MDHLVEEIQKRKKEIQQLIASGNLKKAMLRSLDFSSDFDHEGKHRGEILSLCKRYEFLKQEKSLLAKTEENVAMNTIVFELLDKLEKIESEVASHQNKSNDHQLIQKDE